MTKFRVLAHEIDGVEVEFASELDLDAINTSVISDEFTSENVIGSLVELKYKRRLFPNNIFVASSLVFQIHSPIFEKEMKIDGEVYVL